MIRPENETEDLILSTTKICETLIKQIHTKPQETSEFKLVKSKQHFFSIHLHQSKDLGWLY